MKEKYLPIGTVVTLENATKKLMITGYLPTSVDHRVFDYNACIFPEGVLSADKTLAFNHDKIKEIHYLGFENDEHQKFNDELKTTVIQLGDFQKLKLPQADETN